MGGDGNDKFTGGSVRDLLIGGLGADALTGAAGDYLIIGETTAFDQDSTGLLAILWFLQTSPTNLIDRDPAIRSLATRGKAASLPR